MLIHLEHGGKSYTSDLSQAHDLAIPLVPGSAGVNAFYAPPFEAQPVRSGNFVGSTQLGGLVNFLNVRLNPHGNGTHTECVGHIAREAITINQSLRQFHFMARLVSLYPTRLDNGDRVILAEQLHPLAEEAPTEAFVLRTLPNTDDKRTRQYSGTNPPYLHHEAVTWLRGRGVRHLLLDLPSVDREEDGGQLLAHRAFWQYPTTREAGREGCTITELIYAPAALPDGLYLLNLQIAAFEIDASPSKPVLYTLHEKR